MSPAKRPPAGTAVAAAAARSGSGSERRERERGKKRGKTSGGVKQRDEQR